MKSDNVGQVGEFQSFYKAFEAFSILENEKKEVFKNTREKVNNSWKFNGSISTRFSETDF